MSQPRKQQQRRTRGQPASNGHDDTQRIPPHNIEAERSLIGAALISSVAAEIMVTATRVEDFYRPTHQHIAAAIQALARHPAPIDPVTTAEALRRAGMLDEVGGPGYLAELFAAVPAVSAAAHYAGIVRDTATLRRLIATSADISEFAFSSPDDPGVAVSRARQALDELSILSDRPPLRHRMLSVAGLASLPTLEPVVHELLDFDTVVLAYGRRDSGKSFVAIDLINSVVTGTRWHGRLVTQARAIYVVAEGAAGLNQRYEAWQGLERNLWTPLPAEQLMILPEPVNLLDPAAVSEFAHLAADVGARLIVFDTLARCMVGGDENSSKDAGVAIEQLDFIRRRTGACVIPFHHSGKSLDAGARGSSAFEAAADTVLEIGMTDNILTLTCTKQKNHPQPNPIRLRLRSTGPSAVLDDYTADASEIPKGVLETLAALRDVEVTGGVSASVWQLSSAKSEATFFRHRKDLLTLSLVENVGTPKQPRYQVSDAGTLALSEDSHDPF